MKAVASRRSTVGSAIVAPQHRESPSLPLRPQVGELMSKMDYHKCSAVREECFFSPLFPGFAIFVRSNGKDMLPEMHYQEVTDQNMYPEDVPGSSVLACVVGATFTFEILPLALMSSLAKRSRNVSVVNAGCFVIQLGVEINSPNANLTCLSLLVMPCSSYHVTSCANVEDIAHTTMAKLMAEAIFSLVVNIIAFAGNPSRTTSKGQLAKDKSEPVAMCETTSSMSFYNIVRVESIESFRRSDKNMSRGYTVMDCMTHGVVSKERLATSSEMAAKRSRNDSVVDAEINTPNANVTCFYKTCWLWVLLLTILLSPSGAFSATDTERSEEGTCRYDLTSIAVLSCTPDGVWKPSSHTCCSALLYAIDQVPASDESGACCLCRYMNERWGPTELATTYVLCNGKDRHIISKWSTFDMEKCLAECTKANISFPDMGTSVDREVVQVDDTGKGIWIAVAVFSVMALVCFWYFWRSAAANANEQRRTSTYECEPQAMRRRSVVPSLSPSKKSRARRFSSS